MPKVGLEFKADLMGVGKIQAQNDYSWHFVVKCTNCGEDSPKPVVFSAEDEVDQVRTGVVNLVVSCKFCKRSNDIKVISPPNEHTYEEDDSGDWKRFVAFECRGMEPVQWEVVDALEVTGPSGFCFEAGFDGEEFYDYDEKEKGEASITDFAWRMVKL